MTNLFGLKRSYLMLAVLAISMLLVGSVFAQARYGTVKGTVKDASTGNPLAGTNVFIKDTRLGAVTGSDGSFEILRVPPGSYVLQVSFVGFKTIEDEFSVGNNQTVTRDFSLSVDVLGLGEVVVTGMGGTQIKEKLGVTIAKVQPKEITGSNEANVVAAMAGKVPNVEITSNSGDPGGSAYVRIRGANTITGGTQPLFVVDGVPINNRTNFNSTGTIVQTNRAADINAEDIESMEVLKGAAAAAIYGSRAANGVILITTKSGRPGKTRIEYKASYSFDEVNVMPGLQNTYGQGSGGPGSSLSTTSSLSFGPRLADVGVPAYDHAWEIFETGHNFDQNVTMSGGNEFTTFFMSIGQINQDGVFKGRGDYERTSFRMKATQVVSEKLSMTGNVTYVNTAVNYIQRGSNTSGLLLGALRTPPNFNNLPYLFPENGLHRSYRRQDPTASNAGPKSGRGYDNPFFTMNEHVNKGDIGRIMANMRVDYDPTSWLNINYVLGTDFTSDDLRRVLPPSSSTASTGTVDRDNRTYHEIDNNIIGTVQLEEWLNAINENVSGTLMVGYNLNRREVSNLNLDGDDMGVYDFQQLDNVVDVTPNEFQSLRHDESYFGQFTLDLYDQLYLTGALRNDGSSTFAQDNNRHWFPKVSAAWEFTQKVTLPTLNYGKVRFAYGQAGSQPNTYAMLSGFGSGNFGEGWGPVLSSKYMGNAGYFTQGGKGQEDIKPERTKEWEVGTDLAFFDSRLGFDITYYSARTEDAIFGLPLAVSTGYTNQVANAGIFENKGIEISLNAQPVSTPNFTWNTTLVWATNESNVVSLPGSEKISLGGFTSAQGYASEGLAMGTFWAGDWIRFGRGTTEDGVDIDAAYPSAPDGAVYVGADGEPIEDAAERVLGDPNSDWTGSFRNDFTLFGKVTVTSLIDVKSGGTIWNGTLGALSYFGTTAATLDREQSLAWEGGYGPGAGVAFSRSGSWHYSGPGSGFTGPSVQFMEEGSYVKLREISISYPFESAFLKDLGISQVDIRVSGRNLKTWSDYTGIDPETNLTGTSNLRGFDYFNNPQTRSFIFTMRVSY